MNNRKFAITGLITLLIIGIMPLSAAEGDIQTSGYIEALLNNEYLVENIRLIELAEESFADGNYDEAVNYAAEAIKYAQLSDEYVALQVKIKDANEAIASAQTRLDWAKEIGAPDRFTEIYGRAEIAFSQALDARSREEWDEARESALRVISILAMIQETTETPVIAEAVTETGDETPLLPAQYLVRNWFTTRDCLWNIAKQPQIYGDPFQWRVIYNANRDKLPEPNNPDLIHPGMILDIPSIKGEERGGMLEER